MCTYLYAAFSLRDGKAEGSRRDEAEAVARWRQRDHRRRHRGDGAPRRRVEHHRRRSAARRASGAATSRSIPASLPAGIVVKLAPFNEDVLQHFIYLERPDGSTEPDGAGFEPELQFKRGTDRAALTPMAIDYETVGAFYDDSATTAARVRRARRRERGVLRGPGAAAFGCRGRPRTAPSRCICLKTALPRSTPIVEQGEGAPRRCDGLALSALHRHPRELATLQARRTRLRSRRFPAAVNPVLRPPSRPEAACGSRTKRPRDGRSRQRELRSDAAAAGVFVHCAARRAGEGARGRSRDRADACGHAAWRARRAAAGRAVEPGLQRRHVVHGACATPRRCRPGRARSASSSSGSASSQRPPRRSREGGDARAVCRGALDRQPRATRAAHSLLRGVAAVTAETPVAPQPATGRLTCAAPSSHRASAITVPIVSTASNTSRARSSRSSTKARTASTRASA